MDLDGITKVCDALGLGYSHPRDGTEERGPQISVSCPLAGKILNGRKYHQDAYDSNHSCSVSIVEDGPSLVRCFSGYCGFKGLWSRLLLKAHEADKAPEIVSLLEDVAKIEEVTIEGKVARNRKTIEKLSKQEAEKDLDKDILTESTWDPFRDRIPGYAIERGITVETAKKWGLGYDKPGKRLVFPVRRRDGKLVGMQGRDITGEAERRHHNYEGFKKEKYLLGAHLLEDGKPIVIVEGAVGAVKAYQALYPEACVVAPLGEGFSKSHADTIASVNPPCIYIFTDGDAAGRAIASKIEYQLHGRIPMRLMECPTEIDEKGKKVWDAGNLPEDHIKRIFHNWKPILDRIRWTHPLPQLPTSETAKLEPSDNGNEAIGP